MTCQDTRERIFDRLYGLLEGDEREAFDVHCRDCSGCAAARDRAREQRRLFREIEVPALPPGLADRALRSARPRRRAGLAAAAALILAAAGLLFWSGSDRRTYWTDASGRRPAATGEVLAGGGVLEFPDGSRADLAAGAKAVPEGTRRVALEAGSALFSVAPAADRFTVVTPAAEVAVLGTEFRLSLSGDAMMDKKTALGAGALLTVAVVTGAVIVSNPTGEVALKAGEVAAARTGAAPRMISEAELRGLEEEGRTAAKEADALEAEAGHLRRAGQALLAQLRSRPAPDSVKAPEGKPGMGDFMRAQMKSGFKLSLKPQLDKLERELGLSPEQRALVEAAHERLFEKVADAVLRGELDAGSDPALVAKLEEEILAALRPDQRESYRLLKEAEAEAARVAQARERAQAWEGAAKALSLTEAERALLEPAVTEAVDGLAEKGAKIFLEAMMGKTTPEQMKARRKALVDEALKKAADRLTPVQAEALRKHLEKLVEADARRLGEEE